MKNIFKSIMMVLSGAMLLASCLKEAAPLASEISVDKQEVTFTGYAGSSAQVQKVQVTSNGDWFITCNEDWITVNPTFGTAGMIEVEITVADNVDSYNELNGPRSAVVNFCYGETGVAPLTVKQTGETGLDASRTYSLVKNQEDIVAGSYLIVFKNGDTHIALEPLTPSKSYGYLNSIEVTPEDDVITMSNAAYAFTLEEAETGYNMIMSDNRYLYMQGSYDSFNASAAKADANPWTFTLNEDGTVQIVNVSNNKYVQYSTGYSSAGAYASPQQGGLLPYLYKDAKPKSEEILVVNDMTVPAFATSAKIKVQSNRTWSVRNHDEWIKSFTKSGKGDGVIEVTFDEYTNDTEARTATFHIIGEETNFNITFTQAKVAPEMTVAEFLAEDVVKGDYAILTGSIENIKSETHGNFDLQDETGTVYIYGLYDVNGDKVFTDLGLKEGDIVTIYGVKDVFNESPQMKKAVYISHVSSKIRRKLAFAAETAEATLGNPFTAPVLNGDATDVVYSSSDTEVATVDAATGEVTLVAEGTTTITANGPETETHLAGTASYTLTVSSKLSRALAFSAATASAVIGKEFTAPTLSGEIEGVVYSSSDADVATVDPATGAVTIVAVGETTITATAEETTTHLAGTASYALTVVEPAIADGKYWIVANNLVAKPVTSNFGYLYVEDAWKSASSVASTQANAFTFTSVEGGYTIQDEAGKYYYGTVYNDAWSKNFNVSATLPAEGAIWKIVKNDDDTYTITNTTQPSYLQYSVSYKSFGHYTTAQTNAVLPTLVKVENAVPAVTLASSLTFEAEGGSQTITLPEGVSAVPSCDNAAFTATASANVVTVSAAATTAAQSGVLTLVLNYNGFSLTKTVDLTQKAAPVAGEEVLLDEDFSSLKTWSTSSVTSLNVNNLTYNTAGGTMYGQKGCIKFGKGTAAANTGVKLPALSSLTTAKTVTLTFKAVSSDSGYTMSVAASAGATVGTLSPKAITQYTGGGINSGADSETKLVEAFAASTSEFSVTIQNVTAQTVITITASGSAKRWYLDDVKIVTK